MNAVKEQYFPLTRSFSHRVARWEKLNCKKLAEYRLLPDSPVSVVEYTLPENTNIPPNTTIAYLADLHFHPSDKSRRIVSHLLKHLEFYSPDYLLLGGDITGDAIDIDPLLPVLARLRKTAGQCLAVGGNWEYGKEWLSRDFWRELYRQQDIIYLENELFEANGFVICGTADICSGRSRLPVLDMNKFNILMAHNPDTVVALDRRKRKYFPQLILAGHTHGGQVNIPLINIPLHIHSRYGNFFAHGLFRHRVRGSLMLVSGGVNELSFPWRFNCRRELVIIRSSGKIR